MLQIQNPKHHRLIQKTSKPAKIGGELERVHQRNLLWDNVAQKNCSSRRNVPKRTLQEVEKEKHRKEIDKYKANQNEEEVNQKL